MSKADREVVISLSVKRGSSKPEGIAPDDQTTWTWNPITSGDCQMTQATVTLTSDGTANFSSVIESPDVGDVWEVQGLALIDAHGLELYRIPQFDSAPIASPGSGSSGTTWGFNATLYFPGYMYPFISSLTMYSHC